MKGEMKEMLPVGETRKASAGGWGSMLCAGFDGMVWCVGQIRDGIGIIFLFFLRKGPESRKRESDLCLQVWQWHGATAMAFTSMLANGMASSFDAFFSLSLDCLCILSSVLFTSYHQLKFYDFLFNFSGRFFCLSCFFLVHFH